MTGISIGESSILIFRPDSETCFPLKSLGEGGNSEENSPLELPLTSFSLNDPHNLTLSILLPFTSFFWLLDGKIMSRLSIHWLIEHIPTRRRVKNKAMNKMGNTLGQAYISRLYSLSLFHFICLSLSPFSIALSFLLLSIGKEW